MNNDYINSIEKEMRKGLIEMSVLASMSEEPIYVSDILTLLKNAGLITSEGTLYPLLSRLTKEKMVVYVWEESHSGPPRKYYKLSEDGKNMLANYKILWNNISNSINNLLKNDNGK